MGTQLVGPSSGSTLADGTPARIAAHIVPATASVAFNRVSAAALDSVLRLRRPVRAGRPRLAARRSADPSRAHQLHRDQPLRRRDRLSERRRSGVDARPRHDRTATPSKAVRCRSRWSARVADARPATVRASGRLRVYIQANIHAGEVEGKEAVQALVRDIARGQHAEWLDSMVLLINPIYNADGNERVSLTSRGVQHGPDRRAGHASERAKPQHQPRRHQARDARSAVDGEAAQRLRSARHDRSAHHQRLASRLPPDLRNAEQPGRRSTHRRECRARGWRS